MKVKPPILQQYELQPASLGIPVDWEQVFGRKAPIRVEIGFGNGGALVWCAQKNPAVNYVGFELPKDCILRSTARLWRAEVPHARVICGDARYLLRELFAPASVEKVLMQFPMPWPKEKHAKHRVYSPRFATSLAHVLKLNGCFELVTDQKGYAQETEKILSAHPSFAVDPLEVNPPRPYKTRYEEKWLEEGRSIFRVVATLKENVPAHRFLIQEPMETKHLSFLPTEADLRPLLQTTFREQESVFQVKDLFKADDGWLLDVVSSDESFSQRFLLRILEKNDGRILVRPSGIQAPYYSEAVRFGIQSVIDTLISAQSQG